MQFAEKKKKKKCLIIIKILYLVCNEKFEWKAKIMDTISFWTVLTYLQAAVSWSHTPPYPLTVNDVPSDVTDVGNTLITLMFVVSWTVGSFSKAMSLAKVLPL